MLARSEYNWNSEYIHRQGQTFHDASICLHLHRVRLRFVFRPSRSQCYGSKSYLRWPWFLKSSFITKEIRLGELLMTLFGERVTIARRCDWRFTQAPSGIWIWNLNILCFDFDVGCQTLDYNFGGLILGCIEADFYKWLIFALQKPDVYFRSWQ